MEDKLVLGGVSFTSRLIIGTGKFSKYDYIPEIIYKTGCELVTVAVRRARDGVQKPLKDYIPEGTKILVNTSGARNAEEALKIARIGRELLGSDLIKIEIIPDTKYLMPDNREVIKACELLSNDGFKPFPYMMPDLVSARYMVKAGAVCVMPLGAPIGTNKGLLTKYFIEMLKSELEVPVIVDAGIGKPSQAAEAMELGVDAVLVNTAIATAKDPVRIAIAFAKAVEAGRIAYLAGMPSEKPFAEPSSPMEEYLTGFLKK
ncbi:MAG: thiazole synthase [Spirochaetia bacterium]|nr:thiazole synthase [Spirochaetota bacterium]MCX8096898.1 thiazole synthase [Spirochaetota bacterium]MDW8112461.1 thiazole synthase [Spirochaetia bacterium]